MSDPSRDLDERKSAILRAVVEEYVQTAQPVGSGHVARSTEVGVSPATVRNEMAQLEADGYLVQPHTSAGRIPTEKGYRFFVDHLQAPASLGGSEAERVRDFFARAHGELEAMLQSTTRLLSELTHHAAVVIGPGPEVATVRSVQLVGLGPRVALLVVVLANGAVEKLTIEFSFDVDDARLAAASAHLAPVLVGRSLGQKVVVGETGDRGVDRVVAVVLGALRAESDGDHVFVDGASRVASSFDAVDTVSQVLSTLEQQFIIVTLLQDVLDRGLNVAIGTETGIAPLADCAVVVAPYEIEGEPAGSIGVLGPTRMNYPQALAAVAVVSTRLGRRLSEG